MAVWRKCMTHRGEECPSFNVWLCGEGLLVCWHGPDSYSDPFRSWESMGMFVCVCAHGYMCMNLCERTSPFIFTTETALSCLGTNYSLVQMCVCFNDTHIQSLVADFCFGIMKSSLWRIMLMSNNKNRHSFILLQKALTIETFVMVCFLSFQLAPQLLQLNIMRMTVKILLSGTQFAINTKILLLPVFLL